MKHLEEGDSKGIVNAIRQSFEEVKLESEELTYDQKLVGFASDGASLNRGCKDSIKTNLRELSPWMLFIWCIAHRLELGSNDALGSTEFKEVDERLQQMFYLYRNAPKKLRQLKALHDTYTNVFEFESGGVKPK